MDEFCPDPGIVPHDVTADSMMGGKRMVIVHSISRDRSMLPKAGRTSWKRLYGAEANYRHLYSGCSQMERNPAEARYEKAKIEEPNLRLPKALLKPATSASDDLCYMKIFEDDTGKAQHLAQAVAAGAKAVAAGAQADRKVYRIRNKELVKSFGENFVDIKHIYEVSKATIGLLADAESDNISQLFIDHVGTVEQVRTAVELILDKILETYNCQLFPVILMPPTISRHQIKLPMHKGASSKYIGPELDHHLQSPERESLIPLSRCVSVM